MTAFVALLALDTARIEEGRLDLLPCFRLPAPSPLQRRVKGASYGKEGELGRALRARNYGGVDPLGDDEFEDQEEEPLLQVRTLVPGEMKRLVLAAGVVQRCIPSEFGCPARIITPCLRSFPLAYYSPRAVPIA